jgi:hypothetical protein
MFDAHLFSFFKASSCCSILFFRLGATFSTIHLFREKKGANAVLYPLFIASATLSSGGIFDNFLFKWW